MRTAGADRISRRSCLNRQNRDNQYKWLVLKYFNDFKTALENRGILNDSGHPHYYLDEAEYALPELTNYYNGMGTDISPYRSG